MIMMGFRTVVIVGALALAPLGASAQDAAKVKQGQTVYASQKCQVCHAIAGQGGKASVLDGIGAKLSADELRAWIVNPTEAAAKAKSTKKPPMPSKYSTLPAGDIDGLVAYMQSLK
jgi:mono/diheme cytochrome c family protein